MSDYEEYVADEKRDEIRDDWMENHGTGTKETYHFRDKIALPHKIEELEKEIAKLQEQVESMKCCGTCEHRMQDAEPCMDCSRCSRGGWYNDMPDNWTRRQDD